MIQLALSIASRSLAFGIWLLIVLSIIVPVLAQDGNYALNVNTANCVSDPSDAEPNPLYGGALSSSLVVEDTILLSQPPLTADTVPLEIVPVPAGVRVIVFDVDEQTRSYFRIVFPCEGYNLAGWVEATAVRHRVNRTNPKYAPPGCAQPLQVIERLDEVWISTVDGEIGAIVDLFRHEVGTAYPRSYFYLTRNGREIRDKERVFESSGAFLIRGSVFRLEVRVGDTIGFSVSTSSAEKLDFFSILYFMPAGCKFEFFLPPYLYGWLYDRWEDSDFLVVDQRELLGEVFKEQTGNVSNVTGTTDLSQDITIRRQFRHRIDLRLVEDSGLDQHSVQQHILAAYDLPDQVGEKNCTILADVPAGSTYQYEIEWTQILREGNIEENSESGQGSIIGTYQIVFDLQCQTVSVIIVE